jgi:predicted metal-dependent phosphoesterase TrpH
MVVADLHVHTTESDGQLTVAELPAAAKAAGLSAVAVTDHDRIHPNLEAPVTTRGGVTVINGIELRVESPGQRVDLLGYGVRETADLRRMVDRLQRDRQARGRAIIERVEDRLDVRLPIEPRPGIGRPHIAAAITEVTDYDVSGAFADLIGADCPCFVPRDVPSFERGRTVLGDACAFVGLAHPLRYAAPADALSLCADLDAVERWYPYEETAPSDAVTDTIERYDLLPTGGSDAHGSTLGQCGLETDAYEAVRARLDV